MSVAIAFVHHANQYLITDGYDNRPGLAAVLGSPCDRIGLWRILELHRICNIPANIHVSGTLLEAVAWHAPAFLAALREMYEEGLIEFVGSCYGQNMMPFCSYDYNLKQLNEELRLYEIHLGLDPAEVKTFWPPERLWDTGSMAAVLKDMRLLNRGYSQVIVDDRLLLRGNGSPSRRHYDRDHYWHPELFQSYLIANAHTLLAIPISHSLRQSIPPRGPGDWENVESQLRCLAALDPVCCPGDLLAVYGDDMEKPAGVGSWDENGASQFEELLKWFQRNDWIRPVKVSQWISSHRVAGQRMLDTGAYIELINHFHAGEDYRNWYFDPQWKPYREYFSWSEERVKLFTSLGSDVGLINLAEKHLLASNWETAWHTPSSGAHGNAEGSGAPSPWVRAVASHSRHAAVIAEAAFWMRHQDGSAHAYLHDIDGDGEKELILKNKKLFAVISPAYGGRLILLFDVGSDRGALVIGNPTDDWNWMEELNRHMDMPRNHPGALADVGYENDRYEASILIADGPATRARLINTQDTNAHGLVKEVALSTYETNELTVTYILPDRMEEVAIEFGLSPDYFNLLRHGRGLMQRHDTDSARGFRAGETAVCVKKNGGRTAWTAASVEEFGHGGLVALSSSERQFTITIAVEGNRETSSSGP